MDRKRHKNDEFFYLYTHRSLLHLANLSLYSRQHYPHISSLWSWLNLSISWPQPSTTLCKLEQGECKRLERDLTHLKQRATTGNSLDKENYLLAKQKLTVLEQRDLEAVKIRTKARFTEEGEKSTGYVYSLEKKKQADKSIHSPQKRISTLSLQLVTFQLKHLPSINNSTQQMQLTLTPSEFSLTSLSLNSQQSCEDPFSAPELESTLKKMENNKSPGIDGPTSNFYKHFWPILGPEITQVFNHCRHSLLTRTQCWGIITLIFKKGDCTKFQNWWPITLLTTDYKILTEALATHPTTVLPTIINLDQAACIPGRTILMTTSA